jgi:signal transduction histidine kinase
MGRLGIAKNRIASAVITWLKADRIIIIVATSLVTPLLWMTLTAMRDMDRGAETLQSARAEWHEIWRQAEEARSIPNASAALARAKAHIDTKLGSSEFEYLSRVSAEFKRFRDRLENGLDELVHPRLAQNRERGISGAEAYSIEEGFDLLSSALSALSTKERSSFDDLLGFLLLLIIALAIAFSWQGNKVRSLGEKVMAERAFSRQLDESIEAERSRIAREIHDEIAQDLVFARHELDSLASDLPDAKARLTGIKDALGVTLRNARALCEGLWPPRLGASGSLASAIAELCRDAEERVGIAVSIDVEPSIDDRLGKQASLGLFRIVQEGLANACKHSGSARVAISLRVSRSTEGEDIRALIEDAGKGMDGCVEGMGMRGLRERARLLGGTVSWGKKAGGGTRLAVRVPLARGPGKGGIDASSPGR